jgi:hypothetical protein
MKSMPPPIRWAKPCVCWPALPDDFYLEDREDPPLFEQREPFE